MFVMPTNQNLSAKIENLYLCCISCSYLILFVLIVINVTIDYNYSKANSRM